MTLKKDKRIKGNGRHGRRIDLSARIARERRASPEFREAFDAARQATEIARTLADLRRSRGVSQEEVARRLGTSQQAISRMERPDYRGHSLRMVIRFVEALGARLELRVAV